MVQQTKRLHWFIATVFDGFGKTARFDGVTSRSEFLAFVPVAILVAVSGLVIAAPYITFQPELLSAICIFTALTLPIWSASARRLRESGQSTKAVFWVLLLPFMHLAFARWIGASESDGAPSNNLIAIVYLYLGFIMIVLINFALIISILASCASAKVDRNSNPNEVPS